MFAAVVGVTAATASSPIKANDAQASNAPAKNNATTTAKTVDTNADESVSPRYTVPTGSTLEKDRKIVITPDVAAQRREVEQAAKAEAAAKAKAEAAAKAKAAAAAKAKAAAAAKAKAAAEAAAKAKAAAAAKAKATAAAAAKAKATAAAATTTASSTTSSASSTTSTSTTTTNKGTFKLSFYDPAVLGSNMGYGGVAANLGVFPKGTRLKITLSDGTVWYRIVNDTGTFAASNPNQLDVAMPNSQIPSAGVLYATVEVMS